MQISLGRKRLATEQLRRKLKQNPLLIHNVIWVPHMKSLNKLECDLRNEFKDID